MAPENPSRMLVPRFYRPRGARLALFLAIGHLGLIVWASLTPFAGWRLPDPATVSVLSLKLPRYFTRFDVAINVLAYIPFGFFVTLALLGTLPPRRAVPAAFLLGSLLSLGLEELQLYVPGRISSNLDFLSNSLGALLGAALGASAGRRRLLAVRLANWRTRWFLPGGMIDLGLALLALWLFTQINPSLPLLGNLFTSREFLLPLAEFPQRHDFRLLETVSVLLNVLAVGLLLRVLLRPERNATAALLAMIGAAAAVKLGAGALLLKPAALFQWLSLEALVGIGYGFLVVAACQFLPWRPLRYACGGSLVCGIVLTQLSVDAAGALRLFSWRHGHLLNFTGVARQVSEWWPFLALVYLGGLGGERQRFRS